MYKFTGFTESANNALNFAIESAENFGHTYIGSEHILLGLLSDSKTVSASLLNSKKIFRKHIFFIFYICVSLKNFSLRK